MYAISKEGTSRHETEQWAPAVRTALTGGHPVLAECPESDPHISCSLQTASWDASMHKPASLTLS